MKKLFSSAFMALSVCLFFIACSSNKIDQALDDYEKAVDEYVEVVQKHVNDADKSDDYNAEAAMELINASNQALVKINNISATLEKYREEMSPEQSQRMIKIALKATQAAVPAEHKVNYDNLLQSFGSDE